MIKRGRKSAASMQSIVLSHTRKAPQPPKELTEAAAKLWCDITKSLPADYFRSGDLPLLQSYCTAFDRKNQVDKLIAEHGVMYDGVPHPGLKISRDEAGLLASLAVKLRLCQSSRTRPDSASLQGANTGPRPWDMENVFANNKRFADNVRRKNSESDSI